MEEKWVAVVNRRIAQYNTPLPSNHFLTSSSEEAASQILQSGANIIELVGGDGTLSATLNDILTRDRNFLHQKQIVINPKGSGNDRIKSLKEISRRYKSVDTDLPYTLVTDDYLLATINGKYRRFVFNIAGIGLDSHSLLAYEAMRSWMVPGKLRYFGAASRSIFKLNGYKGNVEFRVDEAARQSAEPIMFLFMLGKYFGGGMAVNHQLCPNDNRFESLILRRGSHVKLFSSLFSISVLQKSQEGNPLVDYLAPSHQIHLHLTSRDKFFFESDGEVLSDGGQPVEVHELKIETAGKITYRLDINS